MKTTMATMMIIVIDDVLDVVFADSAGRVIELAPGLFTIPVTPSIGSVQLHRRHPRESYV